MHLFKCEQCDNFTKCDDHHCLGGHVPICKKCRGEGHFIEVVRKINDKAQTQAQVERMYQRMIEFRKAGII